MGGWLLGAIPGWVACERPASRPQPAQPPVVHAATLDASFQDALTRARQRIVDDPSGAEGWGRYGQILEAAEFHAEAMVCYSNAVVRDQGAARWAHLLGLLQLQNEPEAGLTNLARAASLDGGTNDASRVRLAQALVERGRFTEAVAHLEPLLARRADHPAARLELARVRLAEQKLSEASELLTPCLTNPYTARPAALLLSQIRAREGQAEVASQLSRRAVGLPRPFDWPDAFQKEVQALRGDRAKRAERIQTLLVQGRSAEAEEELRALLTSNPEDPEGLLLSGRLLLQQRKCPEAEQRFREHLRVAGETVNGRMQLALSLLCQQKWAEAEQVLGRLIEVKPDFAQAHANRAVARSRQGNVTGAIEGYRDALRCGPGDAGFHAGMAEELARIGRADDARQHVEQALMIDPNQPRAKAIRERLNSK